MDFAALATAVAAKYAPGVLTPPAAYPTDIRSSTGTPPAQLGARPCVVVFVDEGELDAGNGTRIGLHHLLARFYYSDAADFDLARENAALEAWLSVLVDAHKAGVQLAGTVAACRTVGYKLGILDYAGGKYNGAELRVDVATSEGWAATA